MTHPARGAKVGASADRKTAPPGGLSVAPEDTSSADPGTGSIDGPKYQQIADSLRLRIESGQYSVDSQLPTETELIKEFSASRNTIRDAIKALISLGLVETRPGQGTYVTRPPEPLITTLSASKATGLGGGEGAAYRFEVSGEHRIATTSGPPRVELQKATGEIAARLRVEEGTPLISRHEQRLIDGRPWSLQTSFYPRRFALQGAEKLLDDEDIDQGTVKYLQETLKLQQVGYRDWITMRAPDLNEILFFRIPRDGRIAVFEIFRTAFDQTGTPMRVTVTIFPADRNQFIVDVGDVPPVEYKVRRQDSKA
jgi:GntR family transcriptional regulator